MSTPLTHPRTHSALTQYLLQPTHGVILSGAEGSGKYFMAQWLAVELGSQSYTLESADEKNSITIEQIRQLYSATRTGGKLTIIIKDSHQMGREAQNAFLKLLEEPPENTHFILTTSHIDSLLPTIRSRSQVIEIIAPPKAQLLEHGSQVSDLSITELQSLLYTSKSLAGTFLDLTAQPEMRQKHLATVADAKLFYSAKPYERHLMCINQKFDKVWVSELLDILAVIIYSLLKRNPDDQSACLKLEAQANLIEVTATHILSINGNPKIHLTKLCQQL